MYKFKFRYSLIWVTLLLLAVLLIHLGAGAFGGGTGSADFPYVIETCEDLEDVDLDLEANYILANDLTCTSINLPLSRQMEDAEIDDEFAGFSGVFDGDGNTIQFAINIPIEINQTNYLGLFGYTNGATIKDLNIVAGYEQGDGDTNEIIGEDYVGSLVGKADDTLIQNVYAANNVTAANSVGGIAGQIFQSRIYGSSFEGNIVAEGAQAGGLAGGAAVDHDDGAVIYQSSASGQISGYGNVGGLVGHSSVITISNSYASMVVNDSLGFVQNFGGIAGFASSVTIEDSYATGVVTAENKAGGIVGQTSIGNVTITNILAASEVNGNINSGAVVGETNGVAIFDNVFFDTFRSTLAICTGVGDFIAVSILNLKQVLIGKKINL